MFQLLTKIVQTGNVTLPVAGGERPSVEDIRAVGADLRHAVNRWFRGSLAIRQVAGGSDNSVEQELVALSNPYYDIERFGVHFVASPRHADMLFVAGPVARNMAEAVKRTYDATPDPKLVVAVGDGAIDGGIWRGSYAVLDGVHTVIPVDFQIPGDPPRPIEILRSLLTIVEAVGQRQGK